MRLLSVALLGLALSACSGGSGATAPRLPDVSGVGAVFTPGVSGATCAVGTAACGSSGFCCPTNTACLANPGNTLGCGAGYCCLGCTAGTTCGAGCCGTGTSCVANPGGATGCGTGLCCSAAPDETCPVDVASQCAAGTRCLKNRSAKYCAGGFACYLPAGGVGCPGEVICPNAIDFCPSGNYCAATSGVCPVGSSSGNYCCKTYARASESCDTTLCAPGLSCLANPHCADSDPTAINTCHGNCSGQTNCGNYCCPPSFPICSAAQACWCLG